MFPLLPHTFYQLGTIGSTNLYAMKQLHAGLAVAGDVFFADEQTAGRAQRGKNWWSEPGTSIAMSLVLNTNALATSQSFRLSVAMALGSIDYLNNTFAGKWQVKWPNDLYFNDRKAGGILIENLLQGGKWNWAVVGIGINMNQMTFPDDLPNPVSMRQLSGQWFNCWEETKLLTTYLDQNWQRLLHGGWHQMHTKYNNILFGAGNICRIKKGATVIPCKIKGVDERGRLVAGEHNEHLFDFGEITWLH